MPSTYRQATQGKTLCIQLVPCARSLARARAHIHQVLYMQLCFVLMGIKQKTGSNIYVYSTGLIAFSINPHEFRLCVCVFLRPPQSSDMYVQILYFFSFSLTTYKRIIKCHLDLYSFSMVHDLNLLMHAPFESQRSGSSTSRTLIQLDSLNLF